MEAAGSPDIIREHRNFAAAEKPLGEEIQRITSSTTAGHVMGLATLAAFGLGFFSWNSQADAREKLAELKAYSEALAAEGRKKKCALTQSATDHLCGLQAASGSGICAKYSSCAAPATVVRCILRLYLVLSKVVARCNADRLSQITRSCCSH